MEITAYQLAQRYVGIQELAQGEHPLIQWWLSLCGQESLRLPDETPWCSAFANGIALELRLPRSKSLRARSWLLTGMPTRLENALPAFDVVVINRKGDPSADVIDSPGHVGFYAGRRADGKVLILGGNQGNAVSIAALPTDQVLGVRRLA